ncbi:hypothetical protein Kim5_CH00896 [Rhizobium sp. Kim5]|uniref:hypothetical protein n=1 Tax=Rhizobium sp. Kim5 TaxID=2020311 RepID=UPI000A2A43EB|nr:hypothetical protein [Rhizobium sp. Kim5]ARQ57003.1 hypothetical protein Kim5_CH00896 [Rhizobium sp. Kim5]
MNNSEKISLTNTTRFDIVALGLLAVTSIVFLIRLLTIANRGIDLTDEGYYLAWISDPWIFSGEASQFGYIYHPVYLLVNGNIALLRQLNLLAVFMLAAILAHIALSRLRRPHSAIFRYYSTMTLSLAIASTSLIFFQIWIPTPSYNSLAFQALLIAGIGLLLAEEDRWKMSGWFLIGIAVWLAFMAKPTTAVILALIIAMYFIEAPRERFLPAVLAATATIILILLFALSVHGSITAFFDNLNEGASFARSIGGSSSYSIGSVIRLDIRIPGPRALLLIVTTCVVLTATFLLSRSQAERVFAGLTSIATLAGLFFAIVFNIPILKPSNFFALQLWAVPAAATASIIAAFLRGNTKWLPGKCILPLCLGMFPLAYTFGTMSNYWASGASAGFFWVIAGVLLLRNYPNITHVFLPLAAYGQLLTILVVLLALQYPYRQLWPINLQTEPVSLASGAQLLLSADAATYFKELHSAAAASGFMRGDPVIDLTGQSPGALFTMGAKPVGRAWIIGGYAGSEATARKALQRVGCREISNSWLLTEPNGARSLQLSILGELGINVQTDYVSVASINLPAADPTRQMTQILLRPTRTVEEMTSVCEAH